MSSLRDADVILARYICELYGSSEVVSVFRQCDDLIQRNGHMIALCITEIDDCYLMSGCLHFRHQ